METDNRPVSFLRSRKLIRVIAFLLVLVLLLAGSSALIRPKGYEAYDIETVDIKLQQMSSEKDGSIDVIFAGDSELLYAFSPLQLWGEYGMTSYIISSGGQKICDTYEILTQVFLHHSPKAVVLDGNSFYRDGSIYLEEDDKLLETAERIFPVFHYHTRYKTLPLPGVLMSFTNHRKNQELYKGWLDVRRIEPYTGPADYMGAPDTPKEPIPEASVEYLDRILALCREHDCALFIEDVPSSANWSYARHNAVEEWADTHGVDYLDLNLLNGEIGIDWSTDTRDRGDHLNFYGSLKLSDYMGRLLQEKYALADHRGDAFYGNWQADFERAGLYGTTADLTTEKVYARAADTSDADVAGPEAGKEDGDGV